MSQNKSYIPLDTIITDYMNEAEVGMPKYAKIWHLAFRGMDELGIDFFYRIQAVKLPINSNFTVTLPADYLNWTKVGILNPRGEIIPLYYNNKLTTYADLLPNRVEKTDDLSNYWLSGWNNNVWTNLWNGSGYSNVMGVPSGEPFVGSFKVDTVNGVILLDQNFRWDYLMLEYVCSPLQQTDKDYYVPVQFREAMIAYLWWRDKKAVNINRGQVGISRDLKSEFYNQRTIAIARWKPTRQEEIYQASQEQTRLTVKT